MNKIFQRVFNALEYFIFAGLSLVYSLSLARQLRGAFFFSRLSLMLSAMAGEEGKLALCDATHYFPFVLFSVIRGRVNKPGVLWWMIFLKTSLLRGWLNE